MSRIVRRDGGGDIALAQTSQKECSRPKGVSREQV
jgi:hypothetical protein